MTLQSLITAALAAAVLSWNAEQERQPTPVPPDRPAAAGTLETTVRSVASLLREEYVFPQVGEQMAADIIGRLERGEYDAVTDERALAERLTTDLRAISNDKHLGVVHAASGRGPAAAAPSRGADPMRRDNYAFRKVELLQGNIGYLRFDVFIANDEAKEVASAALAFLANADALVIDLRRNGGGSPDMIRYITSYFFDEPTLLNVMIDRSGEVVSEYRTLESVPGRRFSADMPIYILTSAYTFSGAEEFTYNLKHLGRAVVIGETTGGGAHPVRGARVSDQFVVRVPFMRAHNPISGTNWEGTGVKPHIEVSAEDALDRALREAREAVTGERSLQSAGWPANRAGTAAAAFFRAYGDDEAMVQFSMNYRCATAREGRSDASYAAFWREYAEGAVPRSYITRGEYQMSVEAHLTHLDGRDGEANFRFEFDPQPSHGLRSVNVSTIR